MGGVIGVESVNGSGSMFWIEFPLVEGVNIEPLPDLAAMQMQSLRSCTVLYIEDNPSSVRLVQKTISSRLSLEMLSAPAQNWGWKWCARTARISSCSTSICRA